MRSSSNPKPGRDLFEDGLVRAYGDCRSRLRSRADAMHAHAAEVKEGCTYFRDGDAFCSSHAAAWGTARWLWPSFETALVGSTEFRSCGPRVLCAVRVPLRFERGRIGARLAHDMTVRSVRKLSLTSKQTECRCPDQRAAPHRRRDRKAVLPPRRSRRQPPARQGQPQALQAVVCEGTRYCWHSRC